MIHTVLRLALLALNVFDSFQVLKAPNPRKGAMEPSARALTARRKEMKGMLSVWIVSATFLSAERICDRTVVYLMPFYNEIKSFMLLYLIFGRSSGAEPVLAKVLRPALKPYTKAIDSFIHLLGTFSTLLYELSAPIRAIISPWLPSSTFGEDDETSSSMAGKFIKRARSIKTFSFWKDAEQPAGDDDEPSPTATNSAGGYDLYTVDRVAASASVLKETSISSQVDGIKNDSHRQAQSSRNYRSESQRNTTASGSVQRPLQASRRLPSDSLMDMPPVNSPSTANLPTPGTDGNPTAYPSPPSSFASRPTPAARKSSSSSLEQKAVGTSRNQANPSFSQIPTANPAPFYPTLGTKPAAGASTIGRSQGKRLAQASALPPVGTTRRRPEEIQLVQPYTPTEVAAPATPTLRPSTPPSQYLAHPPLPDLRTPIAPGGFGGWNSPDTPKGPKPQAEDNAEEDDDEDEDDDEEDSEEDSEDESELGPDDSISVVAESRRRLHARSEVSMKSTMSYRTANEGQSVVSSAKSRPPNPLRAPSLALADPAVEEDTLRNGVRQTATEASRKTTYLPGHFPTSPGGPMSSEDSTRESIAVVDNGRSAPPVAVKPSVLPPKKAEEPGPTRLLPSQAPVPRRQPRSNSGGESMPPPQNLAGMEDAIKRRPRDPEPNNERITPRTQLGRPSNQKASGSPQEPPTSAPTLSRALSARSAQPPPSSFVYASGSTSPPPESGSGRSRRAAPASDSEDGAGSQANERTLRQRPAPPPKESKPPTTKFVRRVPSSSLGSGPSRDAPPVPQARVTRAQSTHGSRASSLDETDPSATVRGSRPPPVSGRSQNTDDGSLRRRAGVYTTNDSRYGSDRGGFSEEPRPITPTTAQLSSTNGRTAADRYGSSGRQPARVDDTVRRTRPRPTERAP